MKQGNNAAILLRDDDGFFIRSGSRVYRPPNNTLQGATKGQMVKAWPVSGGLRVELQQGVQGTWTTT